MRRKDNSRHAGKKILFGWWIVLGSVVGWAIYGGLYFYGFGTFFDSLIIEFKSTRALLSGIFLE